MPLASKIRKEKEVLTNNITKCKNALLKLDQDLRTARISVVHGRLTQEEYLDYRNKVTEYKEYYTNLIDDYSNQLKTKDLGLVDNKIKLFSLVAVMILVIIGANIISEPSITGRVIFGMSKTYQTDISTEFNSSENITWNPVSPEISSVSLTGEYKGKGTMSIFLETNSRWILLIRTDKSINFNNICGAACHLTNVSQSEYTVRVELTENNTLFLKNIEYTVHDIQEMDVQPKEAIYDQRYVISNFTIENPRNKNFSVAIYSEGDLTDFTTLYSSYEEFKQNDTNKTINYEINLPPNMPLKTYDSKIIVRYLPRDVFEGYTPVEEHNIKIIFNRSYLTYMLWACIFAFVINLAIIIKYSVKRKHILKHS